jgi:hypothetical protein
MGNTEPVVGAATASRTLRRYRISAPSDETAYGITTDLSAAGPTVCLVATRQRLILRLAVENTCSEEVFFRNARLY